MRRHMLGHFFLPGLDNTRPFMSFTAGSRGQDSGENPKGNKEVLMKCCLVQKDKIL